jgi:hypothetical protein
VVNFHQILVKYFKIIFCQVVVFNKFFVKSNKSFKKLPYFLHIVQESSQDIKGI